MTLFSFFGCSKSNKSFYPDSSKFQKLESTFLIKKERAIEVYNNQFENLFSTKRDEQFFDNYIQVLFIKNKNYYIGYASSLDKRGSLNPNQKFLVQINSRTGEIKKIK